MAWIIKDYEAKTPSYEVIWDENIHKFYSKIGWSYEVYKADIVHIPTDNESPIFYFKGKKCELINGYYFVRSIFENVVEIKIDETELNSNPKLKKMLDIIENYKYKDEVVSIVKETKKGKLFKKNETIYNIKFKGFIVQETDEVITETATSFVVTEKDKRK